MSGINNQGTLSFGVVEITVDASAGTVSSPWVKVPTTLPCNIGFGCEFTNVGAGNYSVQHQFGQSEAFNHIYVDEVVVSMDGNYAYPISAFRLTATECIVTMYALVPGVRDQIITV